MRLNKHEINKIKELTKTIYGEVDIWLFGSRVDDRKKGGDIDLYIETKKDATLMDKLKLMTSIQLAIGNRKIDLIIKTSNSRHRSIFDTARREGILL